MEYTKKVTPSQSKSLTESKVTVIWANDGWSYIPELKLRRKFTETHYYKEDWDGVIPMPEHIETVTWAQHSSQAWQENDELYELKVPNQVDHKSKPRQLKPRQQPQRA